MPENEEDCLALVEHRGTERLNIVRVERECVGEMLFAHSRLNINGAIIEQPLRKSDALLLFNGSIYNWDKIREKYLIDCVCDTDLVVSLFLAKGFDHQAFLDLEGSFSGLIYDFALNRIVLFRDGFFQRPLYLSKSKSNCFVASSVYLRNSNENKLLDSTLRFSFSNLGHGLPKSNFENWHREISFA